MREENLRRIEGLLSEALSLAEDAGIGEQELMEMIRLLKGP